MRLANVAGRAAIVVDGGTLDLEQASSGSFSSDLTEAIARIDEIAAIADTLSGNVTPIDESLLGPPSPNPPQILAIGMNYQSHADEMGLESSKIPAVFSKFRSSLGRPYGEIKLSGNRVDYEVELVVVIKKTTSKVTLETAWDHVAGLAVGQDISDRYVQMAAGRQFSLGKSFPGYAAFGPWLSTIDEFDDPNNVGLRCAINGEVMQDARSNDMIFSVPEALVAISQIITLEAGDVIFTGSPSGAGQGHNPPRFLKAGEELVSSVESVGEMRHTFVGP